MTGLGEPCRVEAAAWLDDNIHLSYGYRAAFPQNRRTLASFCPDFGLLTSWTVYRAYESTT